MANKQRCKQCFNQYTANRADSEFCSPKCCAKWYRDNVTDEAAFHAARERHHVYNCQFCDVEFWINDYGVRGGQREPKFCSTKCRVASHRAVHAAMGAQEGRKDSNTNRQRPPKGDTKAQADARKQREQNKRDKERADREQQQREYARQQQQQQQRGQSGKGSSSAGKATDCWGILGVPQFAPFDQCKVAWRTLIQKYHPDVYKGEDATELSQAINAAFQQVKKYYNKK